MRTTYLDLVNAVTSRGITEKSAIHLPIRQLIFFVTSLRFELLLLLLSQ